MHILFVSHSAELMGAERSLVALVREAVEVRGHRVTVSLPDDGPLRAELARVGADVVVLPTRLWMGKRHTPVVGLVRSAQAAVSVPRYWRHLRRARPDLVVTNSAVVPAGAIAARMAGVRQVWTIRESLLSNPNLRSALPRRTIARIIASLPDGVVVISKYVAGQLLSAAPAAGPKLRVVPPSVAPQAAPVAARRPGPGKLERLVLLGRYTPEKGQADAIEALGRCLRAGRPLHLKLAGVGDGAARRAVQALAEEHGVGHLVEASEWTDDPHALYSWADATLMLSRNEAYGRVTVESLMSGTPVIGYRAGATTEILDGGGGVLVAPDAEALARTLLALAAGDGAFDRLANDALLRANELNNAPSSAGAFVSYLEEVRAGRA
ncbi:Glycosyltransferase involved in cell wall bisynthesis [Micromonospora echinaurantiaca]|uniref:Glycosyltransferase involved in cell wall bisynthesis n=1 Tax=Micromonospora echinaurantiaca TaxID=47857 RepID=A0A1C5JNN6_9ACTN|nr:glycosyltransferase family 4 protein [Micromonospora echinaurantiaca]SCG72118.1 Glycosyltransferase involved in cell wall bisynthesis [Micromonospora echinaurantiaca]